MFDVMLRSTDKKSLDLVQKYYDFWRLYHNIMMNRQIFTALKEGKKK